MSRRKLFSSSKVIEFLNVSDESDSVCSSEEEYKLTKSDLETESSCDEEPSPKRCKRQTPKKIQPHNIEPEPTPKSNSVSPGRLHFLSEPQTGEPPLIMPTYQADHEGTADNDNHAIPQSEPGRPVAHAEDVDPQPRPDSHVACDQDTDSQSDPDVSVATDQDESCSNRTGRRRFRNEVDWKQNIRKRARNQGMEYISRNGKMVQARKTIYHRCGRCVNKCNEVLPDEDRDLIFQNYWKLGDRQRQRDYIASHVHVKQKQKQKNPDSKRKLTMHYYFTTRNRRVKVCKAVFLKTLGIGEKTVQYTVSHMLSTGQSPVDGRKNQSPGIKKPDEVCNAVRAHISSFPSVESHYCRKNTTRKYLSKDLNIKTMFLLYQKMYQDNPSKQVKESYYRSVFNSPEFNHLSFHKPKKDLCCFCVSYDNGTQQEKDEKRAEYEAHIARRDRVLEVKQELKDLAKADENVATASFDLEQVLLCPRLNVSSLFYRRKLATYNLTVYDMGTRDVSCYMWHEGAGGRGCNEIATSIHLYLKSLSASTKRVIFFSDTCSAQNRNQFFSAMCLNAVRHLPIECIDHVYMESGHSHMECDTAHSTIETALKNQDVYSPADYYRIVAMARRKQPFEVIVLDTDDFLDFKALNKSIIRNKKKDVAGNTVHWIKMKWMRYRKDSPDSIMFKYDYDDEFIEMKVNHGVRGRPSIPCEVLVPLFTHSPCITQAKYDDLDFLCNSLAIPRFYHEFYKGLKANKNVRDALPAPDVTEEDSEEVENEIE